MRVEFPSTVWGVILRAADGSVCAMNRFAGIYRPVIEELARAYGFPGEDADDLTQEILISLCDPQFLARADQDKGKFRNVVFVVSRNKMHDAWRRTRRLKETPLGPDVEPAVEPELEKDYNRIWRLQLLKGAMERLKEDEVVTPHPPYHTVLYRHRLQGAPLATIAMDLGTDVTNVKNWVRRGKERLAEQIRAIIRSYSSSAEEYAGELDLFSEFLSAE